MMLLIVELIFEQNVTSNNVSHSVGGLATCELRCERQPRMAFAEQLQ
jgi:hypothetical protein